MKFWQNLLSFWRSWKTQFFWVGHFDFFFPKKKKNFASSPWKLVTNYVLEWMGLNFYDYDGLQPKTTPPKHISRQCILFELQPTIILSPVVNFGDQPVLICTFMCNNMNDIYGYHILKNCILKYLVSFFVFLKMSFS